MLCRDRSVVVLHPSLRPQKDLADRVLNSHRDSLDSRLLVLTSSDFTTGLGPVTALCDLARCILHVSRPHRVHNCCGDRFHSLAYADCSARSQRVLFR